MGFFDNILQINNSFLLIGLIIVAITCIYLLYTNLTKSNDTTSLKTTVMNLIQQNKKRDEIINFLLERIENLEHALPAGSSATVPIGDVAGIETAETGDNGASELDNLLASVQEDNTNDAEEKTALDDLLDEVNNLDADTDPVPFILNSKPTPAFCSLLLADSSAREKGGGQEFSGTPVSTVPSSPNYSHKGGARNPRQDTPSFCSASDSRTGSLLAGEAREKGRCDNGTNVVELGCRFIVHPTVPLNMANNSELEQTPEDTLAEVHVESTDNNINSTLTNLVMLSEFDDLEAEFSGLMGTEIVQESPVHLDNHPDVDIDLVSSILGADDIANMADVEIDLSSIPKDKKRLISKYTTKQLKQVASKLALKTSGSKVELADRISAKLATTDPEVS